jgi:hypothetical protein
LLRHGHADQSAAGIIHFDTARGAGAQHAADRLRQLAQLADGGLRVVRIGQPHLDSVAADYDAACEADARVAQRAPRVVDDLVELVLLHRISIDFEQNVRSALQVEAEHHSPLRPFRPGLHIGFREEVRHREQTDHGRGQDDCERSPSGEVKHLFKSAQLPAAHPSAGCGVFLGRLALGAYTRDHAAHLPHAHAIGDLDLDLVVVDHLRHLADQAAIGDNRIAATQILDEVTVFPLLALLRSQNQKIHDDENRRERQK